MMGLWQKAGLVSIGLVLGLLLGSFLQWRGCAGKGGGGDSTVTITPTPALPPGPQTPVSIPTEPIPGDISGMEKVRELEAIVWDAIHREDGLRLALTDAESTIVRLSAVRKGEGYVTLEDSSGFYCVVKAEVEYDPKCGNIYVVPSVDSLVYPVRTVEIVRYEDRGDAWSTDAIQIAGGVLFGAAVVSTIIATSN